MSFQRKRSSDGTGEAAGCLLILFSFGFFFIGKWIYRRLRYKPPLYQPLAPHVAREGRMRYRTKVWIAACTLGALVNAFFIIGSLSQHDPYAGNRAFLFSIFALVCGFPAWLSYYWYQRTRLKVSAIDPAPLFPKQPSIYTIYPPQNAIDLTSASNLMRSLLQNSSSLSFQIVAQAEGTIWQVIDPLGQVRPQTIMDTIRSHAAGIQVVEEKLADQQTQSVFRQMIFFGLVNEYAAPLSFVDYLKTDDPLITLTRRMDFLRAENQERIVYTLLTLTASEVARMRAWERLKEGKVMPLARVPDTSSRGTNLHGLDEQLLERKLNGSLYHAFLVLTIESERQERVSELTAVASDVTHFGIPSHNQLQIVQTSPMQHVITQSTPAEINRALFSDWDNQTARWKPLLLVLHPMELASLWHLPDDRFTAEHIAWAGTPLPDALVTQQSNQLVLGNSASRGAAQTIYLSLQDRAYHTAVIGKTGTGKSTLLHNLIHQDMAAGRGVVVLDPHGKLIDDLLTHSIPQNRLSHVVLLELGNSQQPVPLNPFHIPQGVSREAAFNLIYWVFRKLYESVWRDRMDYVFRNAIQTLLTDTQATPRDISRILLNADYRKSLVTALDDSEYSLKEFWAWYEAQPKSEQMEMASPILTRTSAFLGNKALELMTCHPESLDFAEFIRANKIVLINLSGNAIQSENGTLGAILLSQLFVAAQQLGYLPDGALPRSYIYVDEVERIVTTPLPEMFATARKFGLSLTLANQYLKQLSAETLEGILGNVGTQLVFEVGDSDSRSLAKLFEPDLSRDSLMKLGTYHMAVKTRAQGKSLPPFIVKTLPPPKQAKAQVEPAASPVSTMTAAQVSTWLTQRYTVKASKSSVEPISTDGLSDYE